MVSGVGTGLGRGGRRIVLWGLSTLTVGVLLFGYHTSTEGPQASLTPAALAPATAESGTGGASGSTSQSSAGVGAGSGSSTGSGTGSSTGTGSSAGSASGGGTGTTSGGGSSDTTQTNDATTTVTGDSEDTQWGPVQVELTISGGKITDVAVPVYPNGNGRDQEINSYALPQLVQETLDAQSAQIDMVSGATVTSDGYLRSLQSALDKAGL